MKERPGKGGADKDIWYRSGKSVKNPKADMQIMGNLRTGKGTKKTQSAGGSSKYDIAVETYAQQATRRRKEKEGIPFRPKNPSARRGSTDSLDRAAEKRRKEILKGSTDGIVNKTAGVIINGVNAGGDAVARGVKKIFDSKGPPAGSFMSTETLPKKKTSKPLAKKTTVSGRKFD